ncbi:hypothetical protein SPRG_14945 [Saprolegnia parasitica CBS 223.65]|uniref:Uncharacterized protein n=1 Tax=Saprolegnia parasitica (strain CBS 223.65) TaxID=695850 RepID=A0A067BSP5_SAPPC|nr:hypothetical protein SPRG_14945 [Saprolegnia parasitica CBS 223.65]KDO19845.1 hypothetical protein SPRG_14945 [Saprolegnia parasitica CBS 223.65]|eukprot:XP_012209457.1 hypothetical protein SPRG_14945 [Saprolegnia parasitica CBS 223.65]
MGLTIAEACASSGPRYGFLAPWSDPRLEFRQLRVVNDTKTLFHAIPMAGCHACHTTMATALDASMGRLQLHVPTSIVALPNVSLQLQVHCHARLADLRIVQCFYFGPNDVVVVNTSLGAVPAHVTHHRAKRHLVFQSNSLFLHMRVDVWFFDQAAESARLCDSVRDGFAHLVLESLHRGVLAWPHPPPALHEAVRKRYPTLLSLLLDHSVPVDTYDAKARTALLVAVEDDAEAMAALLLQRGAAPNKETDGSSPLFRAIQLGQLSMVTCMLQHNPRAVVDAIAPTNRIDPDSRDLSGLMYAYRCNQPEIAEALLHAGASVLGPPTGHTSVLYYCVAYLTDEDAQLTHLKRLLALGAACEIYKAASCVKPSAIVHAIRVRAYTTVALLVSYPGMAEDPIAVSYRPMLHRLAIECDDDGRMLRTLQLEHYERDEVDNTSIEHVLHLKWLRQNAERLDAKRPI